MEATGCFGFLPRHAEIMKIKTMYLEFIRPADGLAASASRPFGGPGDDDKDRKGGGQGGQETGTVTKTRPKTKRPNLYRVLLLNDDYTPMEFVVLVLQDVFNKSREDAMRIMLHVHQKGVGECGVYPYEVAETKVTRVMDTARKNQHPLQCVMEKQ
jgi:ATP-dependent Clp protease adaptor protein ClpS